MSTRADPAILMLVPDHPTADAWRRAASRHQPVIAARIKVGPRRPIPPPDADGVITLHRPRLRARRFRPHAAHRLETEVLTQLVDHLRQQGRTIDIVHSHFAAASTGLPGLRARRDIPYVVSEHSSALTFDNPHKQISTVGTDAARGVYAAADRILPVSQALGDAIVRRRLAEPHDLTVLPNPVDTERFHPRSGTLGRRVVTVARLVGVKRLDLLLEAMARLDTAELDIVGDGPRRRELEADAARRGIGARVHFHGRLERDRVAEVLRTARVFSLSSCTENMPVAALEALATGLPLVAPAVGGLPELLADAPGETCETNDAAALADALDRWLEADEEIVTQRARRLAEDRYSIGAVGARLAEVYTQVVASRTRPTLSTAPEA